MIVTPSAVVFSSVACEIIRILALHAKAFDNTIYMKNYISYPCGRIITDVIIVYLTNF
jgi:hypothetical protein